MKKITKQGKMATHFYCLKCQHVVGCFRNHKIISNTWTLLNLKKSHTTVNVCRVHSDELQDCLGVILPELWPCHSTTICTAWVKPHIPQCLCCPTCKWDIPATAGSYQDGSTFSRVGHLHPQAMWRAGWAMWQFLDDVTEHRWWELSSQDQVGLEDSLSSELTLKDSSCVMIYSMDPPAGQETNVCSRQSGSGLRAVDGQRGEFGTGPSQS